VDARAVASAGLLPGIAPGLAIGMRAPLRDWLSAAADLYFWPEQETKLLGARFAFGLTAVALGACVVPVQAAPVGLEVCGGGWIGSVHAVVFELQPTAPGDRLWSAASASARLFVPIGPTRISLGVLGMTPFTRHRFVASGQDQTIFQQTTVTGSAELGLGLRF
jgi:hypothetical protein